MERPAYQRVSFGSIKAGRHKDKLRCKLQETTVMHLSVSCSNYMTLVTAMSTILSVLSHLPHQSSLELCSRLHIFMVHMNKIIVFYKLISVT